MSEAAGGVPTSDPGRARSSSNVRGSREKAVLRRRAILRTFKVLATLAVVYFIILNIPGLRNAVDQLDEVQPGLLLVGLALEITALFCYSVMTKAALGVPGHHFSVWRLCRIQLSTRALASLVTVGSAAGSALGYRL
ncbi:MAG: hypothetical protein ACKOD2_00460, partial [Ilumatobacteraceae bacterium]